MNSRTRIPAIFLGLITILSVAGCQDAREMQIIELQKQNDQLKRENADLDARLASAIRGGDNARNRAMELQQLVDDLQRQLDAAGPATQEGRWTIAGPYAWTDVGSDILFDPGKAILKSGGKTELGNVVSELQSKFPDRNIWVIGHTDSDPIKVSKNLWKDNLDLSQGRAREVALELIALGIKADRLIAGGQGEYNPKQPNDTKAHKAENRRVQIVAVARPQEGPATGAGE